MSATLLLIDVSNLVHRIYHATALTAEPEALFNFARARLRKSVSALLRDIEPVRFVAAFDGPPGSFRQEIDSTYKGQRSEKPEVLQRLLDEVAPELFADLGAECLYSPNHEADDVIATVADQCLAVGGWRVIIVSQDGDLLSCVYSGEDDAGVYVLRHKAGSYQLWDEQTILESPKYGVPPRRIMLFKTLAGDASDGIKGCPSVGPVTARRWAKQYPTVKKLFQALNDTPSNFTKAEAKRLQAWGLEEALKTESLVRLVRTAPLALLTP